MQPVALRTVAGSARLACSSLLFSACAGDLTKQFARYLDPHFLIPVFRYMKTKGVRGPCKLASNSVLYATPLVQVYPVEVADALLSKVMKSTKYTPKLASEMFPDVPTDGAITQFLLPLLSARPSCLTFRFIMQCVAIS